MNVAGRSWFLRLYLPLLFLLVAIAVWRLSELGRRISDDSRRSDPPAIAEEPEVFARFPYPARSPEPVIRVGRIATGTPVFWGFGSRLLVEKLRPEGDDLEYVERLVDRAGFEALLGACLDVSAATGDAASATFRMELKGNGDRRHAAAIGIEELRRILGSVADRREPRPHLLRSVRLTASAAPPGAVAARWPVASVDFAALIDSGSIIVDRADTIEVLTRHLRGPAIWSSKGRSAAIHARARIGDDD